MEIQLRREHSVVADLGAEWSELFHADRDATPFMSPGWASPWLRHYGHEIHPWVVTAREHGRLVGLAPFVVRRRRGLRLLRVLGKEPADYWDVLARPDDRGSVVEATIGALEQNRADWDLLVLDALPPGSATVSAIAGSASLRPRHRASLPCPGIALPGTLDEYLGGLQRKRRTKFKRHLRRVDEGETEVRVVRTADELPGAIDAWHALRLRQWEQMPGRSLFAFQSTDVFRDFMKDVAMELVPHGLAEVREFRHQGELAGSYLSFLDRRAYYLYLGGFDPAKAKLELGSVNLCMSIRSSIEAGLSYFDFMVGAEPYKYWYGATDRIMPSLLVGNPRARSRAALTASRVWDRVRDRGQS